MTLLLYIIGIAATPPKRPLGALEKGGELNMITYFFNLKGKSKKIWGGDFFGDGNFSGDGGGTLLQNS